jgi:ribosomal protein S18 acetylase RimI-like enzyme
MSEVAELEAVCERAWPPRERLALDGAVLRFTDGFTRRANSARVDGGGDLEGLIARAEREYRSRGLRPGFRLTPLTPAAFEPLLRERGYEIDTEAVVMVADALPETGAPDAGDGIELAAELGEEWLRVFQAIERKWPAEQDPGARWVLGSGDAPRRFALARVEGEPAATGYARIESDWLYIASVATFPERRRLGLARAVSDRLVAWGASEGARRAILQAETKNVAAQALYARLGFEPRYIYRDFVPGPASATD